MVYWLVLSYILFFNLTSYVLFKDWSIKTGIIDTIAGTINCGIAASMVYLFYHKK